MCSTLDVFGGASMQVWELASITLLSVRARLYSICSSPNRCSDDLCRLDILIYSNILSIYNYRLVKCSMNVYPEHLYTHVYCGIISMICAWWACTDYCVDHRVIDQTWSPPYTNPVYYYRNDSYNMHCEVQTLIIRIHCTWLPNVHTWHWVSCAKLLATLCSRYITLPLAAIFW